MVENNWKQEDDDAYDEQTVQDHQEASVRGRIRRSNPTVARPPWWTRRRIERLEADPKGNLYKLWKSRIVIA